MRGGLPALEAKLHQRQSDSPSKYISTLFIQPYMQMVKIIMSHFTRTNFHHYRKSNDSITIKELKHHSNVHQRLFKGKKKHLATQ